LVEEMLAHSAIQVGIPATSVLGQAISTLPPTLRKRVRVLDEDRQVRMKCDAVFRGMADELNLSLGGHGVGFGQNPTQIQSDAAALYLEFYPYLLALEYEMEVAIDVPSWADRADEIRSQLRNPEARAILSVISGIARTYGPMTADAPIVRP